MLHTNDKVRFRARLLEVAQAGETDMEACGELWLA